MCTYRKPQDNLLCKRLCAFTHREGKGKYSIPGNSGQFPGLKKINIPVFKQNSNDQEREKETDRKEKKRQDQTKQDLRDIRKDKKD